MSKHRNITLDMIKLFAAYMVVMAHVPFYGKIGEIQDALTRFSVPVFLAAAGFHSTQVTPGQIKKRIINILRLLVFAVVFCTLWKILMFLMLEDLPGLVRYFSVCLDVKKLLTLLLLNSPLHLEYLWYMYAVLTVYILHYAATVRNVPKKTIYILAGVLLLAHILLGEGLSLFHISVPVPLIRNFLFVGIPFFGIGMMVGEYRHRLSSVPNCVIVLAFLLGIAETLLSRFLIGKNEIYLGSVLIFLGFVLLFVKYPNIPFPSFLVTLTGCSTYIYIVHPVLDEFMELVYAKCSLGYETSIPLQMIHPIVVCILSTLAAFVLIRLTKMMKMSRKKQSE